MSQVWRCRRRAGCKRARRWRCLRQAPGLPSSLPGDERKYRARLAEGLDSVEVAFLSASEIAGELGQAAVDLGITGEDLLRETLADWEERAEIVARLGFGPPTSWWRCRMSGSTSRPWPISTTSPPISASATAGGCASPPNTGGSTQQFFSQKHGIQVYRIVESLGATEGAPAAGLGRRHRRHHHHRLDACAPTI